MAKSRAQRKAEKRRREEQARRQGVDPQELADQESRAQQDTQSPVSGDVAEAEAVIRTGADPADYGEHTQTPDGAPTEGADQGQASPAPAAPAPSRADVGQPEAPTEPARPAEPTESRRERRRREKEQKKEERRRELQKAQAEKAEKRRGGVMGFFASCWAELKKVQWPDRDTLVQASAVTIIFVAVMAAYLGGLDAAFNWMIKQII
jgi:preprotein translocase subunit SecE